MVPAEHHDLDQDSAQTRSQTRTQSTHLTPFRKGEARAAEAGRKGAETRRAQKTSRARSAKEIVKVLDTIVETFDRSRLGPQAAASAGWLLARITAGQVPIRNAEEAASLLRALVDVARLEEGQPTSTALVAHVGASATAEVLALRDQARAALGMANVIDVDQDNDQDLRPGVSSPATAEDDTNPHEESP